MSSNDIAFWGMIGTWFTGLATFSAVVISLYISTKQTKIKLKCSFDERDKILGNGQRLGKCLFINIINLSLIPINIEPRLGIGMIPKRRIFLQFWKKSMVWMLFIDERNIFGNTRQLLHGEDCSMTIDFTDNDNKWYTETAMKLYKHGYKPSEVECYVYVNQSIKYRFPFGTKVVKQLNRAYGEILNNR